MNSEPGRGVTPTAPIVRAFCTNPVLATAFGAAVALASAGCLALVLGSPPASIAMAAAPVVASGTVESDDKARDSVIWRDETGAIYRAKIGGGRFERFLRDRRAALDAARTESRNQAAAEILAALKPVFADMRARTPAYADWYFSYTTRYELMAHALLPALDYLSRVLDRLWSPETGQPESMVQTIGAHMVDYLKEQYSERVVRPRQAEPRLQLAFDKTYGALQVSWTKIIAEQRRAMRAFIKEEGGAAERLPADQATGLKLDWDGTRAAGGHKDVVVNQDFRGGLLSVTLKVHRAVEKARPDVKETAEQSDDITHVIVNLFDKVVGPAVSQMGDLLVGIVAGGAASGTTAGLGMTGTPMMVASGVAAAAPVGAAIGLAATIVAEMLSNRLEEALTRKEFEESIRRSVDATENAIETKLIAVLDDHIEAWYVDVASPVAVR